MEPIGAAERKALVRLTRKKHRRAEGRFLVEGRRLVEEALASGHPIERAIVDAGRIGPWTDVLDRLAAAGVPIATAARSEIDRLSDAVAGQGLVLVVGVRADERPAADRAIVVLDRVGDPANVGAILRSAWAFGLGGALCLAGTAERHAPKTLRASMGGALHLPVVEGLAPEEALARLRAEGRPIVATAPRGGVPAHEVDWQGRTAFLIGSEAEGLTPALAAASDLVVTIEQEAAVESLNAAVAAGILFHLQRLGRRATDG